MVITDRIKKLDISKIIKEVINSNIDVYERFSAEQLERGELPDGTRTPVYRNQAYVARKSPPKAAPGNRWNLRLTGAFWRGITAKTAKNAITWPIGAQEGKYRELRLRTAARSEGGKDVGLLKHNTTTIALVKRLFLQEAVVTEIRKQLRIQ